MKKNLYINDVNVTDFGFYINSDTYLDAPSIDYNTYTVPARNGNVIQYNKRFNNIVRKIECYIPYMHDVQDVLDKLKKLIYSNVGYLKIRSDYEPDYFQYGYLAQEIKATPFDKELSAKFDLYFSCEPQKIQVDPYYRKIYRVYEHNDRTILSRYNSELISSALDDMPYYAETYDTYNFIEITQLGLASPVSIHNGHKRSAFIICEKNNDVYSYTAFVGYRGGFTALDDIPVPDQYNTSTYYLCAIVPTATTNSFSVIVRYGGTSMSKSYTTGTGISISNTEYLGSVGEIWLAPVEREFTAENIENNVFDKDDGIIAFNDAYIRIDWYQMYLDGMLDIIRECKYNDGGYLLLPFRVNMQTKKSYLYYQIDDVYTNIDKYVTIFGEFEFKEQNYLSISRKSSYTGASPLYYSWSAIMSGNWWKV